MSFKVAHAEANPDGLPIPAPSADLSLAMAEQMRRNDVAAATTPASAAATPFATAAIKAAFLEKNTGFFICQHANLEYPMRCMVPNIRFVDFFPAASDSATDQARALKTAQRRVRALSLDPRLQRVINNIVPANQPHLIPYSEAAAADPEHVLSKINRNANRLLAFFAYRDKEFNERAAEVQVYRAAREAWDKVVTAAGEDAAGPPPQVPPPTASNLEKSEYHRYKTYLSRRRTLKLSSPDAVPTVAEGDEVTAADALRQAAAAGRAVVTAIAAPSEFVPPAPLPGLEAFMSMDAAPTPVFGAEEELPEALLGADLHPDDQVIGEWPRDLERRATFMNLAIVDDLDIAADSVKHAGAAGMEPMVIPFGGTYDTEEEAKHAARDQIAPWAAEMKVCTVCMNGFLWSTEVDPDQIKEEHRTGDAGGDAEMALVMGQNKTQKATAARARVAAAAADAHLRETNVNQTDVPDVADALAASRPAVSFAGEVQQFARGVVPATAVKDTVAAETDTLPDV